MFGMSPWEMGFIFLIILVIFGPKSLPKIGQSIGRGIREFKDAAQGLTSDLHEDSDRKSKSATASSTAAASPQVAQTARSIEDDLTTDDKVNHSV